VLIKKTRIPVLHIITIGFLPSFLKKFVYRLKGYKIASDASLSLGCVVIGKDVEIGKKSSIGFFTIIRARKIKIARYVKIGAMSAIDTESISIDDDARINEQVYIGGTKTPQSSLIMGKRTIIMQASYINPTMPITIGDDSGIGGHCLLFTHGSWNSVLEGYPVKFAPIHIGKKVWLPWRVFIMPGVSIGDGVVVGADSMINRDIPANCLVAGSPAKIIKEKIPQPLQEEEKKEIIDDIFKAFIQHLNHHDFVTEQKNTASGFELTIKNKNTRACILFCEKGEDSTPSTITNSILVLNRGTAVRAGNYGMAISLESNTRIGTSDTGEELVQFFSRYGVRFNRLD
jgi:acetyltransferase-like isoleucine patch superfamily enzyme